MVISNSKKPLFLPLLAFFMTMFLMLMLLNGVNPLRSLNKVKGLTPLFFKFEKFDAGEGEGIILQGDAVIVNNAIQLTLKDSDCATPLDYSVGRAYYSRPLHLWDRATGQVTDFKTTFTFKLTSPLPNTAAHGLAFFIAPPETTIPYNSTGGFLGLFAPGDAFDPSKNQIVFVEIDTYSDEWDPPYEHIGINVNVINSTTASRWKREEAKVAFVDITYNSANRRLTAVSCYPDSDRYQATKIVDLNKVLPEFVQVGFSAATGAKTQTHDILSWSFEAPRLTRKANEKEEEKHYIARFL